MSNQAVVQSLGAASRSLASCAKTITAASGATGLAATDYEMLIGVGIAKDWIGWARELDSLNFSSSKRAASDRSFATTELTRFTFMWTAANALFSRDTILARLTARRGQRSELDRFGVLVTSAALPSAKAAKLLETLHAILSIPMHQQHFPWTATNNPPTLLEVIFFKYTLAHEQTRGLGNKLSAVASSGNYAVLDLPTLIYATRNWNVHGVLLSSAFRGTRKKFNLWITTANLALALILQGAAAAL